MPTRPACDLMFEASNNIVYLTQKALDVFADDILEKRLPVYAPEPVTFSKVAKTKDGRIVGGVVGVAQWNHLDISHVAVHPNFRNRGIATALMKCAEEAARGDLVCNQIHLSVLSWQPRHFFAKLGYKEHWALQNHPRGHTTHYFVKEWPMGFRDELPQGYDAAATDTVLAEWDVKAATAKLDEWINADAIRHDVADVFPCRKVNYGLKALHSNGSLAAVCTYYIQWNMLYVSILTVMKGEKKRGAGSAVLRKMDEIAREHDCDHVVLHTMSWQARPFYEKNGFVCVAMQRDLPFTFHRYVMHRLVPKKDARSNL